MLTVGILNLVILNVVLLSVIAICFIVSILSVTMPYVVVLSVLMPLVAELYVVMVNVVRLSVVMPYEVLLSECYNVAICNFADCTCGECCYAEYHYECSNGNAIMLSVISM